MKAVLFDLDGTLLDSIELIVACFTKTIETHLGYTPEKEWILSKIGKPLRPILEELYPDHGELLAQTYRAFQYAEHDNYVSVFPGIEAVLVELAVSKKLGIVTSKGRGGTEKALTYFVGSQKLFSAVVTADDSQVHKPEPQPLLQALATINAQYQMNILPEECFYVGDTIFDMQASRAAGMTPIGVTWGVGTTEILSEYTNLIAHNSDELLALCA